MSYYIISCHTITSAHISIPYYIISYHIRIYNLEAVSKIQRHSWVPPKPAAEFLHTGRVRCISYYMHNIPYQIVFHHLMLTCHIFNHTKLYHIRLSSYHYHHIFRSYDMISLFISYHTIHDISFSPSMIYHADPHLH